MSVDISASITPGEASVLAEQEAIIARGLQTFYEVGIALTTIRDQRLYREDHGTFEDYCQHRWGLKQSRAYQFIDAAGVVDDLKSSTIVELPANESQARPLAALPPEQRAAAWQEGIQTAPGGKVTGAHIADVVDRIRYPDPKPEAFTAVLPQEATDDYTVSDEDIAADLAPPTPFPRRPSLVPSLANTPEAEPGAYSRYALLEQYNGAIGRLLTAARYAKDLYRHTPSVEMAGHLTDQEESDDDAIILDFTEWIRSVILARQSGVKVRRVK